MKAARRLRAEITVTGRFPASYPAAMRAAIRACAKHLPARAWKLAPPSETVILSLSIVGRAKIRELNRRFRGKDKPTDVLSFSAGRFPGSDLLGDIVICWDVARGQLADFGTTPRQEIQRLTIHGVLHLFGYDHETSKADAKRMFALQEKILRSL